MLQVWKIETQNKCDPQKPRYGWVLAETIVEAQTLADDPLANVRQMPDHLWIAKERIIWVND